MEFSRQKFWSGLALTLRLTLSVDWKMGLGLGLMLNVPIPLWLVQGQMSPVVLEKNGGRRGTSAFHCRGNFQHKLSMRKPIGFLTSNLNGIFSWDKGAQDCYQDTLSEQAPGLWASRLHGTVGPSLAVSLLTDGSWVPVRGSQWCPGSLGTLESASVSLDHAGFTICPEGWSGHMWGPATSRDSYEHPCCSNPGVLFTWHYTRTAFTSKQYVRGLSWIWTMQSSSCPQKTGIYSKIREVSSRTQAGQKRDWLGNQEETGTRSEQYWSHFFILSKTDMRYPLKLCPNCRLIRTKLSWATKFGVVCYVAVASWNLPGQASFSLISIPGYLSDSQLRSYGEKSFHPVESFQTPGESKEWPSSRESYFTLPTSASPLV